MKLLDECNARAMFLTPFVNGAHGRQVNCSDNSKQCKRNFDMAEKASTYDERLAAALEEAGFDLKTLARRTAVRKIRVKDPEDGTKWKVTIKSCE